MTDELQPKNCHFCNQEALVVETEEGFIVGCPAAFPLEVASGRAKPCENPQKSYPEYSRNGIVAYWNLYIKMCDIYVEHYKK